MIFRTMDKIGRHDMPGNGHNAPRGEADIECRTMNIEGRNDIPHNGQNIKHALW